MKQYLTETKATEIRAAVTGREVAEYSTFNPVLNQHCLHIIRLVARLRCTEDARNVEKIGTPSYWLEFGWVDGSHPSMQESYDSAEEATNAAKAYAEANNFRPVTRQSERDALDADWRAKRDPLYADYRAKRDPLYADYRAKRDPLDADYQAKRDALYADYKAKRDPLDADYRAKMMALYRADVPLGTWNGKSIFS